MSNSHTTLVHRLARLEGQIRKLQTNLEHGDDCSTVIPQFLAVKGAVNSAFAAYVQESITECAEHDTETLQRLVAHLARS